jgi:voltage-gated potassium channel
VHVTRLERWERRAEWPLAGAAIVFLVAYGLPIAVPGLPSKAATGCTIVVAATWAAFAVDYVVRFRLAERKWHWFSRHLLDLAVIALPILRPLRLLRLVALIGILNRTGASTLRGRVVTFVIGGTVLLVTCGALAITDAERGRPGANIANLGDGFWWAMTTMTTVGYGDRYPTTPTGRAVAATLMLGGIALLGVVTATLASWLVERVAEAEEAEASDEAATRAQVDALAREIRELRETLTRQQAVTSANRTHPSVEPRDA